MADPPRREAMAQAALAFAAANRGAVQRTAAAVLAVAEARGEPAAPALQERAEPRLD